MRAGYIYRKLSLGGRKRDEHRVVVEAALGRTLDYDETVHHLNGNKRDNRLENLSVVDRVTHGRMHSPGMLFESDVAEIRGSSQSHAALARRFGVSKRTIFDVKHRRTYSHLP